MSAASYPRLRGGPAVAMLVSLFVAALTWNIGTWWFGLPNSSSHCLCRKTLHDKHLYEPATDHPPIWWMRGLLILTCSGVSFAHGTNDGQKSIGLIMLTIIGIFPATYALNPSAGMSLQQISAAMQEAKPWVVRYGDDQKAAALAAVGAMQKRADAAAQSTSSKPPLRVGPTAPEARTRTSIRGDVYEVVSQLRHAEEAKGISADDKKQVHDLAKRLGAAVEYAPLWVRLLSAVCLGVGTMIGYKRIVKTLGERLGNAHLTPAQGAAAEVVSAVLIGSAGFTGLPVSTTHIVTSGIAIAWVFTLPVTILVAGGLYYLLASPRFN